MRTWQVTDGARRISFEGVKLATSTSREPGKSRWINLMLFRTSAGLLVLAGTGHTREEGEETRRWALTFDDPQGVVGHLTMRDEDTGARYLPTVARRLLEEAATQDARIHDAYYNVRIA